MISPPLKGCGNTCRHERCGGHFCRRGAAVDPPVAGVRARQFEWPVERGGDQNTP